MASTLDVICCMLFWAGITLRVHVPNIWVLGFWVIVVVEKVVGKYMIIRCLDP